MSKVVLITGASSGIGKVTGMLLKEKGHKVYGVSRSIESEDLPFESLNMDVTDEVSVKNAIDHIVKKEGKIDVLINSAGFTVTGSVEDISNEEMKQQFETNVFGVLNMIRNVLPTMRKAQSGLIINISSIGGLMGLPFQGAYSATKYAVEGISEALSMELKAFNIKVRVIAPGDLATAFTANRKLAKLTTENSAYTGQFETSLAQIVKDENGGKDPVNVAKKVLKLIDGKSRKFRSVVAIFEQKMAVTLKAILPYSWFEKLLKKHYKLP